MERDSVSSTGTITIDHESYTWDSSEYNKPYRDPELLYELYHCQKQSLHEIGDHFDVDGKTIQRWLEKGGYSTRSQLEAQQMDTLPELKDKQKLFDLYQEHGSLRAVASELDVHHEYVRKWMEKHGIDRRGRYENRRHRRGLTLHTHSDSGHEFFIHTYKGKQVEIKHHRLLAALEYEISELSEKDIHHENHIPWDNRLENLIPMEPSKHMEIHGQWSEGGYPWLK